MGIKSKLKKFSKVKSGGMSRKEMRKKFRKDKKAKKNDYFRNKKKEAQVKKVSSSDTNNANKITKPGTQHYQKSEQNMSPKNGVKKTNVANTTVKSNPSFLDEQNKLHKKEVRETQKLEKKIVKQRKKTLLEANINEDKEIKKLEKQLKLNKRKSKSIPKSFAEDGLDYLLEVCDADKLKEAASAEMNVQESGSEFEDDFAVVTGKRKRDQKEQTLNKSKKTKTSVEDDSKSDDNVSSESENSSTLPDVEEEEEFSGSDSEFEDDRPHLLVARKHCKPENQKKTPTAKNVLQVKERKLSDKMGSDSDCDAFLGEEENEEDKNSQSDDDLPDEDDNVLDSGSDGDNNALESDNESEIGLSNEDTDGDNSDEESGLKIKNKSNKKLKDGMWEDIYGRLRDKKGNVIQEQEKDTYIPPHLRAKKLAEDSKKSEELIRLRKQLKGLINRLAESNMHSITNQIDELYMRNSRNDMNDTLLSLITEALVSRVLTAERLVMEHALLIAVLHANVGMEVGAHFLQTLVQKFDTMFSQGQDVEDKQLDNVLLIISHLYNFKVFHAVLMYNLLDRLIEQFTEKEVELILLVLRSVGLSLRKDNPLALRDVVVRLQKKAGESFHLRDNPRVRFMLDVLMAVKNNNMAKIPQYDPSHSEHLKKLLKTLVHKGKYVTELKVTLEDLLKADERGRWWIVGSAWSGAPTTGEVAPDTSVPAPNSQYSQKVLDAARKQRMNTDTRRNIFCILVTSEDYLDAFEKLLRLGLKGLQEREIIHVMVHCLLQEKEYNPFYSVLATHFCQSDRKHQMTLQYHLWDKLKEISNFKSKFQITNLAKFLAHLFLEKALPISVLKVVEFSDIQKPVVSLVRQVLLSVLLTDNEESLVTVFARVARSEQLHMFRQSLRLFLHVFVLKKTSTMEPDQAQLLRDRVKLAETALISVDTSKFF